MVRALEGANANVATLAEPKFNSDSFYGISTRPAVRAMIDAMAGFQSQNTAAIQTMVDAVAQIQNSAALKSTIDAMAGFQIQNSAALKSTIDAVAQIQNSAGVQAMMATVSSFAESTFDAEKLYGVIGTSVKEARDILTGTLAESAFDAERLYGKIGSRAFERALEEMVTDTNYMEELDEELRGLAETQSELVANPPLAIRKEEVLIAFALVAAATTLALVQPHVGSALWSFAKEVLSDGYFVLDTAGRTIDLPAWVACLLLWSWWRGVAARIENQASEDDPP